MNRSLSPASAVTTTNLEGQSIMQPPLLPHETTTKLKLKTKKRVGGATPAFTPSRKAMAGMAVVEQFGAQSPVVQA